LLVAASPRDGIADTHWYRAEVDQAWVHLAVRRGAELIEGVRLESIEFSGDGATLHGRVESGPLALRCRFVVDASGPRGFLARALELKETPWTSMPRTEALFSHFREVRRWDALQPNGPGEGLPYPPDDAALHHVFPGGWIWVLRFDNGLTSAGVAATAGLAARLRLSEGPPAWGRLLAELPSVAAQFERAEIARPFQHLSPMAWRSSVAIGEHWALLPSAAGFVDPLLSTGFPLTLLGIERLAVHLARDWNSPRWATALARYEALTLAELDLTAEFVGALYRHFDDFETFTNLTLLYFAAASYAEAARRLERPQLADGFLLGTHPVFGPALRRCLQNAAGQLTPDARRRLAAQIRETIDPINVAGLGNPARRNWYPVSFDDLFDAAEKLQVDRKSIAEWLRRLDEQFPD
jgi:FADH2 O2-dependent halogenase